MLGVDQERFQTLSVDKYWPAVTDANFITEEATDVDFGEPILNVYPIDEDVTLLDVKDGRVRLAANDYGRGRGVYISGLPYSAANARLLERALFYASRNEDRYAAWSSTNPECEVAHFPERHLYCVVNNTDQMQTTRVQRADGAIDDFTLAPSAIAWQELE